MASIFNKPLIGVVMCQNRLGAHPAQTVHNKYLDAVLDAGGVPLALPQGLMAATGALNVALAPLDGIVLTGSYSNIEPHHYGASGSEPEADPGRDRLAFALIASAIAKQLPLLAICRGMQELVVASGGTLHRQLHSIPGFLEHRENPRLGLEQQYAPHHDITVAPQGLLASLTQGREKFRVNSLHQQGVATLGAGTRIEARADDGLIEAVSLVEHPFALAVQWHPEWQSQQSALSPLLFKGFIHACHIFREAKGHE